MNDFPNIKTLKLQWGYIFFIKVLQLVHTRGVVTYTTLLVWTPAIFSLSLSLSLPLLSLHHLSYNHHIMIFILFSTTPMNLVACHHLFQWNSIISNSLLPGVVKTCSFCIKSTNQLISFIFIAVSYMWQLNQVIMLPITWVIAKDSTPKPPAVSNLLLDKNWWAFSEAQIIVQLLLRVEMVVFRYNMDKNGNAESFL